MQLFDDTNIWSQPAYPLIKATVDSYSYSVIVVYIFVKNFSFLLLVKRCYITRPLVSSAECYIRFGSST